MKKYLTELFNSNYFFVTLVLFVLVLPLSEALVSVAGGLVLLAALIEDTWQNKWVRLKRRKVILLVPIIFILYMVSTLFTLKHDKSFYDVQKTMFYLVFPFAFSMGKEINSSQKRFVLFAFAFSVLTAIIISLFRWKYGQFEEDTFSIHNISLISHIRFSFQLNLVIWFLVFFLFFNYSGISKKTVLTLVILLGIYAAFLALQQSLTGLIAFGAGGLFFSLYLFSRLSNPEAKIPLAVVFILLVTVPIIYLNKVVNDFYDIEEINTETIDKVTAQGNTYYHNYKDSLVENGHYVYLYVCAEEMREEWNKRSELKYDSLGENGYPVSSTLIRYITSKGLRKDAGGVQALTDADVANVEKGIANVVFAKKYSLYPRIYQTIWEYYVYTKTGNSNNKSFSQRIEYVKAAFSIIKSNWLFGVGTGNWRTAFANAFEANHAQLDESRYASSHNQYLNYMVKFGIPGFILIIFLLAFPVIKTRRYRDPLFLLFLTFMFFVNFSDSNLESHMGSSFFFFFYCFFLTGPAVYLRLNKPSNVK
ncbi:O-antigen ligase family protein [Maribellus sediminis]|uniref:O-antigen ligase family protein n=1 Tax=Maribellus sediminis TaxID=2696285 RepID=UPI0014309642|nr:O-antigen ligase family protein [Maribellus sediminis]